MTRLIATVFLFFLLWTAIFYGEIWDYQANPMRGVEILFTDGKTISGNLSMAWNGDWILTESDQSHVRIPRDEPSFMRITQSDPHPWPAYWQRWRIWGPIVLVGLIGFWIDARIRKRKH